MIDHYDWAGGREAMVRFGPDTGPVMVAALPLFEEANRTRAFVVTILRALAARGIAGALPNLPGQGESLVATEDARVADLRRAFAAACAGRRAFAIGVRSGALLDAEAVVAGRWHLAPQTGAELLRELERQRHAGDGTGYGGNAVAPELLAELGDCAPQPARTVRLDTDPKPADLKLPGAPLWRRAEPDNDSALAERLADDIAAWVRACEG
ncbi:hypothetical protein ACG3SL_10430 [Sphingomonas sp. CJ20]